MYIEINIKYNSYSVKLIISSYIVKLIFIDKILINNLSHKVETSH